MLLPGKVPKAGLKAGPPWILYGREDKPQLPKEKNSQAWGAF